MSKQSDIPLSLSLLKKYVIFSFKNFYGEYIVKGRENIPADCPVIYAPNHINALMDALAVHSISTQNVPVTFLARSDIFNNKLAGKFLNFIKMIPAFRMRDGMENLGKNNEVFERCVDILHQNNPLGIMPEGNQGEEEKLRMFTKGIFRIAFAAQQKFGTEPGVKIVPVGINLGDYVKFGKHIIINIGKPIEVSEFMTAYAENPVTVTNEIRNRLSNELSKLTLNIATETHYESFKTITEVCTSNVLKELKLPNKTFFRFVAKQKIAEKLVALEKEEPEKINMLALLSSEYSNNLHKMGLRNRVLEQKTPHTFKLLLDGLILLATLPLFIFGLLMNVLPFFIPVLLRKYVMKVKFYGFFSSVHFAFGIFSFPIFYLLQTIIFAFLVSSSWWAIILFFFSQYIFGKLALLWYRSEKKYFANIRYFVMGLKKSPLLERSQNLRKQIIQSIKI